MSNFQTNQGEIVSNPIVYTIDLNFHGKAGAIAAYIIPHSYGAILVETGPGSTIPMLLAGLKEYQLEVKNISDVFLTHIHLDHAGASGWLAQQGARIHVHSMGAPHLLNPEKLLSSATRIYGERMEFLWGKFLPVPEDRLSILKDGDIVDIDGLCFHAIETLGHASHHFAYMVGDLCFSGDIGGVRLQHQRYINLPMPPPDLHLGKWKESIHIIQGEKPRRIAPTHFGLFDDAEWHLASVTQTLAQVEAWMNRVMPSNPPLELLRRQYIDFEQKRMVKMGLEAIAIEAQQIANPPFMSADGIQRYWNKYHTQSD
jgi:glyoxylase-like metal-dependent hydrolase (beta-lactamase superfamily II)